MRRRWMVGVMAVLDVLFFASLAVLCDAATRFGGTDAPLVVAYCAAVGLFCVRARHYHWLAWGVGKSRTQSLSATMLYSVVTMFVEVAVECGCCRGENIFFLMMWALATAVNLVYIDCLRKRRSRGAPPLPEGPSPVTVIDGSSEDEELPVSSDKSPRGRRLRTIKENQV